MNFRGYMNRFWIKMRRRSAAKLSKWWTAKLSSRSRIVPLAMLIGVVAAIAAAVLHWTVMLLEKLSGWLGNSASLWSWILLCALPFFGLCLSYLCQRVLGGPRYAKSLSPLILALNRRKTRIPFRETFNHIISSALSVGLGGSAGLEAPSVLTGAAIGANTSGFFGFDRRTRLLMTGCGAAAAISAIFGSPIGGALFAVEVLLPQFSVGALIPILISSAVAMVISRTFFPHEQILFVTNEPWVSDAIPFYFVLAVICAFVGVTVIRSVYKLTGILKKKLPTPYIRLLTGGVILCIILAIFPVLKGQGYHFIAALFDGDTEMICSAAPLFKMLSPEIILLILVAASIFLKAAVSALTVESGGDGGIFAPVMFVGAFTGFAFARLVNMTGLFELQLQELNFVVAGMCGVFSAVLRAPLTGVFLIADVTDSYILLVPLMIVSALSWAAARHFEPHSIYIKALAENGLLSEDSDKSLLQTLSVRVCIDTDFVALSPGVTMTQMQEAVENAPGCEYFPVLDSDKKLLGVVKLDQLKPLFFDQEIAESLLVFDLMETPACILNEDDDLLRAMSSLERHKTGFLPVNNHQGIFMGFVTEQEIFKLYRGLVRESNSF